MTVTTTQNKSRNHIINKKIPDTLSGWHTLQSNNQIKIKHYQVLFPDDTHYNQSCISKKIFLHIPQTMNLEAPN